MNRLILASVLSILAGCATSGGGVTPAQVAAVEVSVTEAETLALAYVSQPGVPPQAEALVLRDGQSAHDAARALRVSPTAATLAAGEAALEKLRSDVPSKE